MPSAKEPVLRTLADPSDLSHKLPRLTPRRRSKQQATPFNPAPETPPLPAPPAKEDLTSLHPTRRILSPHDHELFLDSPTYTLIVSFIFTIADSIKDTPISSICSLPVHPTITALLSILDSATTILTENPVSNTGGNRFGNPIFRIFLSSLSSQVTSWHRSKLHITDPAALDELHTYLTSSFGSSLRIDYGSGHELNYLTYLLCLNRYSLLPPSTFPSIALILFPAYIRLMRALQETYYLEPAGSHGVWGLDDYHFLPFLFGASQLSNHAFLRPLAIHSDAALEAYGDDFLYLDMVRHVNATKTVQGLRWHSPMLDDISGVKEGWGKVYGGMKKMFLNEVLGKLVVMQHFLFGGLVPAVEGMSEEVDEGEEERVAEEMGEDVGGVKEGEHRVAEGHEWHAHNESAWGDCCGIKVPSSVGATQEMRKRMGGQGLRRLPFD